MKELRYSAQTILLVLYSVFCSVPAWPQRENIVESVPFELNGKEVTDEKLEEYNRENVESLRSFKKSTEKLGGKKYRFTLTLEPQEGGAKRISSLVAKAPTVRSPIHFIFNHPRLKLKCKVPSGTKLYPVPCLLKLKLSSSQTEDKIFTVTIQAPCKILPTIESGKAKFDYSPDGRASVGDYWWTNYPEEPSFTRYFKVFQEFELSKHRGLR